MVDEKPVRFDAEQSDESDEKRYLDQPAVAVAVAMDTQPVMPKRKRKKDSAPSKQQQRQQPRSSVQPMWWMIPAEKTSQPAFDGGFVEPQQYVAVVTSGNTTAVCSPIHQQPQDEFQPVYLTQHIQSVDASHSESASVTMPTIEQDALAILTLLADFLTRPLEVKQRDIFRHSTLHNSSNESITIKPRLMRADVSAILAWHGYKRCTTNSSTTCDIGWRTNDNQVVIVTAACDEWSYRQSPPEDVIDDLIACALLHEKHPQDYATLSRADAWNIMNFASEDLSNSTWDTVVDQLYGLSLGDYQMSIMAGAAAFAYAAAHCRTLGRDSPYQVHRDECLLDALMRCRHWSIIHPTLLLAAVNVDLFAGLKLETRRQLAWYLVSHEGPRKAITVHSLASLADIHIIPADDSQCTGVINSESVGSNGCGMQFDVYFGPRRTSSRHTAASGLPRHPAYSGFWDLTAQNIDEWYFYSYKCHGCNLCQKHTRHELCQAENNLPPQRLDGWSMTSFKYRHIAVPEEMFDMVPKRGIFMRRTSYMLVFVYAMAIVVIVATAIVLYLYISDGIDVGSLFSIVAVLGITIFSMIRGAAYSESELNDFISAKVAISNYSDVINRDGVCPGCVSALVMIRRDNFAPVSIGPHASIAGGGPGLNRRGKVFFDAPSPTCCLHRFGLHLMTVLAEIPERTKARNGRFQHTYSTRLPKQFLMCAIDTNGDGVYRPRFDSIAFVVHSRRSMHYDLECDVIGVVDYGDIGSGRIVWFSQPFMMTAMAAPMHTCKTIG